MRTVGGPSSAPTPIDAVSPQRGCTPRKPLAWPALHRLLCAAASLAPQHQAEGALPQLSHLGTLRRLLPDQS